MPSNPPPPPYGTLQSLATYMAENGSCISSPKPMMTFGSGNAPGLNYNMEQKAGFTAYGHFRLNTDKNTFLGSAQEKPGQGYYQRIKGMPRDMIERLLHEDLLGSSRRNSLLPRTALAEIQTQYKTANNKQEQTGGDTRKAAPSGQTVGYDGDVVCDYPVSDIVDRIQEGLLPIASSNMTGSQSRLDFIPEPTSPNPNIFILEEYTCQSFLGDYGAGATVKTFTLLPGEKTTITVRTYKELNTERKQVENVLDSFSEESASDLEQHLEDENNTAEGEINEIGHEAGVELSATAKFKAIAEATVKGNYQYSQKATSNRQANARALNRALSKQVQKVNNNRNVEVNTSTQESYKEGMEETITRELHNINKGRVLNFVFRQLLQEYVTITYLSNIRLVFTNGYPESMMVVDIEEMDTLLERVVKPEKIEQVRCEILRQYYKVRNVFGDNVQFLELNERIFDLPDGFEACAADNERYFSKKPGFLDQYPSASQNPTGQIIQVPGPILQVEKHILRTDSVIADALLGQGEALDCFGARAQDNETMRIFLENAERVQQLDVVAQQMASLDAITDPVEKAAAYKKIFGSCCENKRRGGSPAAKRLYAAEAKRSLRDRRERTTTNPDYPVTPSPN